MNANTKKWMTAVAAVTVATVVAMSGGNAVAKKETQEHNPCGQCAQVLRSPTIECVLVSCQGGCQYSCTPIGPVSME